MNPIINPDLYTNRQALSESWNAKKPFRYLIMDHFFTQEAAEQILTAYPSVDQGNWDSTTYIHQKNKFQQTKFEPGSVLQNAFDALNDPDLLNLLHEITGIGPLIPDAELFGGGLHQSMKGAFLDVHVDYNYHPKTKNHRRLNLLVYMNKDWNDAYEGHLELWDMDAKKQLDKIAPNFNRMVMFETNEISYHGHPKPLNTPPGLSRKSLAVYYYSETRPEAEISEDHNTIYVNTEGVSGKLKTLKSGLKALGERVSKK